MIRTTSTTLRRLVAASCSSSSSGASSAGLRQQAQRATFASGPLEKTAYHQMHIDMKGKMVPFAGYELPVLYESEGMGVMNETLHCRAPGKSSVFDVSHMGQLKWTGKDAADFLEKCVVGDIKGLKAGEGRLTLITNASGGIVDDTVVSARLLMPEITADVASRDAHGVYISRIDVSGVCLMLPFYYTTLISIPSRKQQKARVRPHVCMYSSTYRRSRLSFSKTC